MTGPNTPLSVDIVTANERFELLAKATRDAVWDWNLEANTVWWNEGFSTLFGHGNSGQLLGPESWSERIHPDDKDQVLNSIHEVIDRGGENWSAEYRFQRADGSYAYIYDRGYIMHRDGKSVRMVGSMQDISSFRELQKQREDEQEHYRLALMATGLGTWDYNPVTGDLRWDDRCRELFGLPPGAPVTWDSFVDGLHPDDRQPTVTAVQQVLMPNQPGRFDIEYRTVGLNDQKKRWLRATGQTYFDEQGNAYRFIGTVQNLTEQKQKDRELKVSEDRFKMVIDQAPVAMLVLRGEQLVFETVNDTMLLLLDKTHDIIGKPLLEAMPEMADQSLIHILQQVYQTGTPYYGGETLVRLYRHGQLEDCYFNIAYTPIRQRGQITGVIEVATDVTEQVKARIALEKSEERLRTLIGESPFAIGVYITEDIVIETVNNVLLTMWSKDNSVLGKPMEDAVPELKGQPFIGLLKNVYKTGETYHTSEQRAELLKDGQLQPFWFNFTYKPLKNAEGKVYAILHMAVDVTTQVNAREQLKQAEENLRKAQQNLERQVEKQTRELRAANQDLQRSNANLQQFAYIASHDLQEPLRKIQSFSSLIQSQYANNLEEAGQDMLRRMQYAGERMSALIRDLLAYSRITTRQQAFGPVSLDLIVARVIDTLDLQISQANAQVTVSSLPVLNGDEVQLSQLFQNLISNAIKFHVPDSIPTVTINCRIVQASALPGTVRPTSVAERFYQINVTDNGIGFENKYLDRIFEVFQRLHGKSEYVGTGIGLAICQKVVANHGGAITATSQPGKGATFQVYLPV